MPTDPPASGEANAIDWHLRLRDAGVEEWEAFADWLALDPRHETAYDEVALTDRALDATLSDWARATRRSSERGAAAARSDQPPRCAQRRS